MITDIDNAVLGGASPATCSVAQRMSWAATRQTTRVEDMAYSLMGLFDVNMSMIYGEGERAFLRLQEEIMKYSDDHSLFAWNSKIQGHHGLLARSVTDFEGCSHITRTTKKLNRGAYSLGNVGLSIGLVMRPFDVLGDPKASTYLAALDCEFYNKRIGIYLKNLKDDQFARISVKGKGLTTFDAPGTAPDDKPDFQRVYIRQDVAEDELLDEVPIVQPEAINTSSLDRLVIKRLAPPIFTSAHAWGIDAHDMITVGFQCRLLRDFGFVTMQSKEAGVIATIVSQSRTLQVLRIGLNDALKPYCQVGLRWDSDIVRYDAEDTGALRANYLGFLITLIPSRVNGEEILTLDIHETHEASLRHEEIIHETTSKFHLSPCHICRKVFLHLLILCIASY
ncbi:MAG: hypothetical protein MMC23_006803 [Stictis urceolatum]|nr:hypothetical protein [Stictis urceolata]